MIFALIAGVLLGLFQVFHRKANENLTDNKYCMILLLTSGIVVIAGIIAASDARDSFRFLSWESIFYFGLSGFVHFFIGFNLLNISQRRVGAGTTGVLLGTTPVFTAISGFLVFQERLRILILLGIFTVVAGIVLVSLSRGTDRKTLKFGDIVFGLATALCYSVSPIWVRMGLKTFESPLMGVGLGMAAALAGFLVMAVYSALRGKERGELSFNRSRFFYEIFAGIFIGIATWTRYIALEMIPLAVVTTIARVSVLVVLLISPLILKGGREGRTAGTWFGAVLVLGGAAIIALT